MKDYSNKQLDKSYDIVVCGGGISSLYFLYSLLKSNITRELKILLVEASNRLGGRVKTFDETISFFDDKNKIEKSIEISYEEGAGRISSTHKLTMSLLKELGLKNNLHNLVKGHHYFYDNKFLENENELIEKIVNNQNNDDPNLLLKLWTEIYHNFRYNKYDRIKLEKISFVDFLKNEYKNDIAELLIFNFGYSDIDISNAWDTLETIVLSYDMIDKGDFYVLGGGLQQVIYKLIYRINILLKKKTNIKIEYSLNTPLIEVKNKLSIVGHKKSLLKQCMLSRNNKEENKEVEINIMTKFIYVALTKSSLNQIDFFKRNLKNTLKSIGTSELLRIYAVYPKNEDNKVWFHNLKSIITDTKIKYIIPINYETGLIMISYTDNDYAEYWRDIIKNGEEELITKLNDECKKIFPDKNIPKPIFINYHDWLDGVHHIKIGESRRHIEEDIIKMEGKGIFIGGEIVSKKQAWIEGALETALHSVKVLRMMNFFYNQDFYKKYGGSKNKDITKNITLEELETKGKKMNWIGIRGMVYDVTKFINIHPGGANIFKGMGKDHTTLWNKSHNDAIFKSHLETAEGRKKYGIKLVGKLI